MTTTLRHPSVNIHNWRSVPEFVDFLSFDFDLDHASPDVRQRIITLLPAAVGEGRLSGAIINAVLQEAIRAWNRPPALHGFLRRDRRWRYLGAATSSSDLARIQTAATQLVYGRLKRNLAPGTFCSQPSFEVIRSAEDDRSALAAAQRITEAWTKA
jgi:hypothetical protein